MKMENRNNRQYQSFSDLQGDSNSLQKLIALHYPNMIGKSFLDIGCNEGFFCGAAKALGAAVITGIDMDEEFTQRAKNRFPSVEFITVNWDYFVPKIQYDFILLASALHYATDQQTTLNKVLSWLSPNGYLILELGIAEGNFKEWVTIQRHDGPRKYPTRPLIENILSNYAYKIIGKSIKQAGDPIDRWVIHVTHLKRMIIILDGDSNTGKSTLSTSLNNYNINSISVDLCLREIFEDKTHTLCPEISIPLNDKFSYILEGHLIMNEIFTMGLYKHLVLYIFNKLNGPINLIDGYIPKQYRETYMQNFISLNCYVWSLSTSSNANSLTSRPAFYNSFVVNGQIFYPVKKSIKGHVDSTKVFESHLNFSGWAMSVESHSPIKKIIAEINGCKIECEHLEFFYREDLYLKKLISSKLNLGFNGFIDLKHLSIESFDEIKEMTLWGIDENNLAEKLTLPGA